MTTDEDRERLRQLDEKLEEARQQVWELEQEWEEVERRIHPPTPEEKAYLSGVMRVLYGEPTGPLPEKLSDIIGVNGEPADGWTDLGPA